MKRTVPLLITAIAGFVLIISFFLPAIQEWGENAAVWFDILAGIAFILGGGNLLKLHLKSMSDRKPGWGYSAVTLVAFVATLLFGLLKVGSAPNPSAEFYGQTFARFPLEEMPEYRVAGSIPQLADDSPLPKSVREQLREEDGELVFRGWMSDRQKKDLLEFKNILAWQCQVEQLFDASQPQHLDSKVTYHAEFRALAVKGVFTDDLNAALVQLLPETESRERALERLETLSRRTTRLRFTKIPKRFQIPEDRAGVVSREGQTLTVIGPISQKMQDEFVREWSGRPPGLPLSKAQEQALRAGLESRGKALNEEQSQAFDVFFAAEFKAPLLIATINSAVIQKPIPKTACELLAERSNNPNAELIATIAPPEPVFLNAEQVALVETFIDEPGQAIADFKAKLESAGPLNNNQKSAIDEFLLGIPTAADQLRSLGIELLRVGPLSNEQQEFLFSGSAEQHLWETEVGRLFVLAHQVKHPWAGEYSSHGNPFWWIYEYVLQPLMTTTFAMLAFYVASAAFRAFRAKNLEAILLLGTAFIVLLGRTYLGVQLTAWVPDALSAFKIDQMTVYIMKIFNTAGNRAIMIGIALGIASTSLKVLLGIDRSYLGSGDD